MSNREKRSRRHPWVTYTLVLSMLVVFAVGRLTGREEARAAEAELAETLAYFERYPFVELPARLVPLVGAEDARVALEEYVEKRREKGLPVLSDHIKAKIQANFDQRSATTFASMDRQPAWRYGVRDSETPALNCVAYAIFHSSAWALAVTVAFLAIAGIALESAWGSLAYGIFVVVAAVVSGLGYTALHADLATPWIGGGGVVAALLGAYVVPPLLGSMRLPLGIPLTGAVLLPCWAMLEFAVVRGIWIDSVDTAPFGVHVLAAGLGFAFAVGLRITGLDKRFVSGGPERELISNPVLDQAMQERGAGRPAQALALLEAEYARDSRNTDVALAFWEIARDFGRPAAAAGAVMGVIRDQLKRGQGQAAAEHWVEASRALSELPAEPTLLIRIAQALIEQGLADEAMDALGRVLDAARPISSAVALRIVRLSHQLEPVLAQRAASIALADPELPAPDREWLEELAATSPPASPTKPDPKPAQSPTPVAGTPPAASAAAGRSAPASDDAELDPHALGVDALEEDLSAGPEPHANAEDMERWNDPGVVEDLSAELSDDSQALDVAGLTGQTSGEGPSDAPETAALPAVDGDRRSREVRVETGPEVGTTPGLESAPEQRSRPVAIRSEVDTAPDFERDRRVLKLLTGVPLALGRRGLKVEVDGKGKSNVPMDRIDALAVAAVRDLADKPVILVDVVLNWVTMNGEPLKVMRFRSDRFDPRKLVSGADSSLDALRAFVSQILERSEAMPLPNAGAVQGRPFVSFDRRANYEQSVLMVDQDA